MRIVFEELINGTYISGMTDVILPKSNDYTNEYNAFRGIFNNKLVQLTSPGTSLVRLTISSDSINSSSQDITGVPGTINIQALLTAYNSVAANLGVNDTNVVATRTFIVNRVNMTSALAANVAGAQMKLPLSVNMQYRMTEIACWAVCIPLGVVATGYTSGGVDYGRRPLDQTVLFKALTMINLTAGDTVFDTQISPNCPINTNLQQVYWTSDYVQATLVPPTAPGVIDIKDGAGNVLYNAYQLTTNSIRRNMMPFFSTSISYGVFNLNTFASLVVSASVSDVARQLLDDGIENWQDVANIIQILAPMALSEEAARQGLGLPIQEISLKTRAIETNVVIRSEIHERLYEWNPVFSRVPCFPFTAMMTFVPYAPFFRVAPRLGELNGRNYNDDNAAFTEKTRSVAQLRSAAVDLHLQNSLMGHIFNVGQNSRRFSLEQQLGLESAQAALAYDKAMRAANIQRTRGQLSAAGGVVALGAGMYSMNPRAAMGGALAIGAGLSSMQAAENARLNAELDRQMSEQATAVARSVGYQQLAAQSEMNTMSVKQVESRPSSIATMSSFNIATRNKFYLEIFGANLVQETQMETIFKQNGINISDFGSIRSFARGDRSFIKGAFLSIPNVTGAMANAINEECMRGRYIREGVFYRPGVVQNLVANFIVNIQELMITFDEPENAEMLLLEYEISFNNTENWMRLSAVTFNDSIDITSVQVRARVAGAIGDAVSTDVVMV